MSEYHCEYLSEGASTLCCSRFLFFPAFGLTSWIIFFSLIFLKSSFVKIYLRWKRRNCIDILNCIFIRLESRDYFRITLTKRYLRLTYSWSLELRVFFILVTYRRIVNGLQIIQMPHFLKILCVDLYVYLKFQYNTHLRNNVRITSFVSVSSIASSSLSTMSLHSSSLPSSSSSFITKNNSERI